MLHSGSFVGRDEEVNRLRDLVGAVAGGRGGSFWVEGEAGIGKSALLQVGRHSAERAGCQVSGVRCSVRQRTSWEADSRCG